MRVGDLTTKFGPILKQFQNLASTDQYSQILAYVQSNPQPPMPSTPSLEDSHGFCEDFCGSILVPVPVAPNTGFLGERLCPYKEEYTYIDIYIYIYMCVCVLIYLWIYLNIFGSRSQGQPTGQALEALSAYQPKTRTANSRVLEHGLRMIRAGIPFSIPYGVWGQGCSIVLEFTGWEETSSSTCR